MAAITLINSFEVPRGREHEFFEFWKEVNAYMQACTFRARAWAFFPMAMAPAACRRTSSPITP
jgi:hypothetical protein